MKAPFRPVIVYWEDAVLRTSDYSVESAKKFPLAPRRTIGWLLGRDKEYIRLAHTFDPPDGVSDVYVIPAKWVQKIKKL